MEFADLVRLVVAGVIMLGVAGAAVIVGIIRADRDERRRWNDTVEQQHRLVNLWEAAGEYLRTRPLDAPPDDRPTIVQPAVQPRVHVDADPTRPLIRHRCPACGAPAAAGADGLLRCLNRCRSEHIRGHRWAPREHDNGDYRA